MDVSVAGFILAAGSPVLAIVALGTRAFLGPRGLYYQERGGHGGETFEVVKFRSMQHEQDEDGRELSLEERAHPWGEFLRRSSLDELPGLINVLRGEMCLVGPRPLVARYLDRYDHEQSQRHRLPPGLTGLAQTSGRNLVSWEDRFDLDNQYIDELSIKTDLQILATTAWHMFTPWLDRGTGHSPEFFGSETVEQNNELLVGSTTA